MPTRGVTSRSRGAKIGLGALVVLLVTVSLAWLFNACAPIEAPDVPQIATSVDTEPVAAAEVAADADLPTAASAESTANDGVDAPTLPNETPDSEEMPLVESRAPPGMPTITLNRLPPEALDTIVLIEQGGPFPYRKDGSTFQNREGLLPAAESGYYSEYTVETPGSPDRGARRIVGGAEGELYYTEDHYASFYWIELE